MCIYLFDSTFFYLVNNFNRIIAFIFIQIDYISHEIITERERDPFTRLHCIEMIASYSYTKKIHLSFLIDTNIC